MATPDPPPGSLEDNLFALPADKNPVEPKELSLLSTLFHSTQANRGAFYGLKFTLLASVLFLVVSLPLVDTLLASVSGTCSAGVVRLVVKTLIFAVIFYLMYSYMK